VEGDQKFVKGRHSFKSNHPGLVVNFKDAQRLWNQETLSGTRGFTVIVVEKRNGKKLESHFFSSFLAN